MKDCEWKSRYLLKSEDGQENFFSKCTSLTVLVLPNTYDLQYYKYTGSSNDKRPDSMIWESNTNIKVYVYHTVNDLRPIPPAVAISDFWHRTADKAVAPIVFYAETTADIITGSAGSYTEIREGTVYWTMDNGNVVYLGTASVNAQTGLVTFSTPGYYADGTHIYHS